MDEFTPDPQMTTDNADPALRATSKLDLSKPGRVWFGLLFMSFFQTAEQVVDPANAHRKMIFISAAIVCLVCALFWPFALSRRLHDIGLRTIWTWPCIGGALLVGLATSYFSGSPPLGVFAAFALYLPLVLIRRGFLKQPLPGTNLMR